MNMEQKWVRFFIIFAFAVLPYQMACEEFPDDELIDFELEQVEGDEDDDQLKPENIQLDEIEEEECIPPNWGNSLSIGQTVANWSLRGFIDADHDGVVEQNDVSFNLEQFTCGEVQSIVLMVGDTE